MNNWHTRVYLLTKYGYLIRAYLLLFIYKSITRVNVHNSRKRIMNCTNILETILPNTFIKM